MANPHHTEDKIHFYFRNFARYATLKQKENKENNYKYKDSFQCFYILANRWLFKKSLQSQ